MHLIVRRINFAWSVDIGYMQKAYGKQKNVHVKAVKQ